MCAVVRWVFAADVQFHEERFDEQRGQTSTRFLNGAEDHQGCWSGFYPRRRVVVTPLSFSPRTLGERAALGQMEEKKRGAAHAAAVCGARLSPRQAEDIKSWRQTQEKEGGVREG